MPFVGETAEIVPGLLGLTGNRSVSQIQPGHLLVANNLTYESGTLRKEGGSAKYNPAAIAAVSVIGGHDWWPTELLQRMIVMTSDGKLLKDSGTGTFPVTLATGLTVTEVVPVFVDGGKEQAALDGKLFIFTEKNDVQVLTADGATTVALATPPADWATIKPITGAIHENRLWGAAGHRAYYSTFTNHEDFAGTGSGNVLVYPGEGDKIVSVFSFKNLLIVFKSPRGIYAIDTSDNDITKWRPFRITQRVGTPSPRGVVQTDDDMMFLSTGGDVHVLSGIQEFGDMKSSSISVPPEMDDFVRRNANLSKFKFTHAIYYEAKQEVHFTMSSLGLSVRNRRMVVDLSKGGSPRFRFSDKDDNESLWLRRDSSGIERPTSGDAGGTVWLLDQEVRSKDGAGFVGEFQTAYDDFRGLDPKLGTMNKNAQFLEIVAESIGQWDLLVDVLWDGKLVETIPFNMGGTGVPLGVFTLGIHALGGDSTITYRKPLHGGGRRVSLKGRNGGAGQDFSVARFYVGFKRAQETPQSPSP